MMMMGGGPATAAATNTNAAATNNRRISIASCLTIRTVSDALPPLLKPVLANGRTSVAIFFGSQLLVFVLWWPFWVLSLLVTEVGVYCCFVATVFIVGRGVLRSLAFPGSSHRVSGEIEKEFARYSVRVLTTASGSLIELGNSFRVVSGSSNGQLHHYNIRSFWKRAKSLRDRVLVVYASVLKATLREGGHHRAVANGSNGGLDIDIDIRRNNNSSGNNGLVGEIGDLSGLTPEAVDDGIVLLKHLENVLEALRVLEDRAGPRLLEYSGAAGAIPEETKMLAATLVNTATELFNFVESLRLPSEGGENNPENPTQHPPNHPNNSNSNPSITDTIRSGLSAILPMLDPPLHSSIFGFDVLRGCVLSRYVGARQLWVNRPSGGRVDCLHIPARPSEAIGSGTENNSSSAAARAVLYCNPNAGLIEVATGMSLSGGNVTSEVVDNCWTDFYTNAGFDIYLYNYAGFGRSHGTSFCGLCPRTTTTTKPPPPRTPGILGRIKRIFSGLAFGFRPSPASLREDGLAMANHVLLREGVGSLVIHGESIGGIAASSAARALTTDPQRRRSGVNNNNNNNNHSSRNGVALLLCDRTFCNLEAVAQRLVGSWSGYAIRMLTPFWSFDVLGDYLSANCPKVVATDSADQIIAGASSLKDGIAYAREMLLSPSSATHLIGWRMDAPLHHRIADWENVGVDSSRYATPPPPSLARRMTAPLWPSDKHVSTSEAFHFAACARRIGKLASIEKKRFAAFVESTSSTTNEQPSCPAPVYLVWKFLGCCEGLCGDVLGVAVKGGFDATVYWLSTVCVFGGQTIVEGIEHRSSAVDGNTSSNIPPKQLSLVAEDSDFDCRPPGYEQQESDAVVHPKPIPEVLEALREILGDHRGDAILNSVSHEVAFVMGTLEYIVARLSARSTLEMCWKSRHLGGSSMSSPGGGEVGSFLNLNCGHNNPYSAEERTRLREILVEATRTPLPEVV
jgi:hypothetical protein